jgi:hypothetical protein
MSSLGRWALVLVAGLIPEFSAACSNTCDTTGSAPVRYVSGTTNLAGTYYESSAWTDTYLDFPAGRTYEFVHGLNTTHYVVKAYLGFSPRPLADDAIGNVAESAGNQVIYEKVGLHSFQVRNDTCAQFYLRVVAFAVDPDAPDDAGPEAGAGGADGGSDGGSDGGN